MISSFNPFQSSRPILLPVFSLCWVVALVLQASLSSATPSFPSTNDKKTRLRIATFNLENFLLAPSPDSQRKPKPQEAQEAIIHSLLTLQAHVIALQEMGSQEDFQEFQTRLKNNGIFYPYQEWVQGWDTNLHIALLSQIPITEAVHHVHDPFVIYGKPFQVRRGILEATLTVNSSYQFKLFTTHLKSRLPSNLAHEEDLRREEARQLRRHIDQAFQKNPKINLVVLGDFNDSPNSKTLSTLKSRGKFGLIDTRPVERSFSLEGVPFPLTPLPSNVRKETWTHFFSGEDSYSRIDYILLSPGMAREWQPDHSYVQRLPNWGQASDHCPVLIEIITEDR